MRRPTFTAANAFLIVLSLSVWGFRGCHGRIFSFEMHHRFSDPVRQWSQSAGKLSAAWPEKGSYEYFLELFRHDQVLRGRRLPEIDSPLAFSDGNSTIKMNSLGLYAVPPLSFLRKWGFEEFLSLFGCSVNGFLGMISKCHFLQIKGQFF